MMGRALCITLAILLHLGVLLFGGLFFLRPQAEPPRKIETVDLLAEDEAEQDKERKPETKPAEDRQAAADEEKPEEMIEAPDPMPDLRDLAKLDAATAAPALDAVSLSAMEDLLNATAAAPGGFYTGNADLASGGRIGGTGTAAEQAAESVFSISELDQKPRPLVQPPPTYPFELRRRKVEGSVSVLFVVNEEGRVVDPRVERSTDAAFERPALEAVRQWRFEPAVRGGQKVKARIRVPLRFAAS